MNRVSERGGGERERERASRGGLTRKEKTQVDEQTDRHCAASVSSRLFPANEGPGRQSGGSQAVIIKTSAGRQQPRALSRENARARSHSTACENERRGEALQGGSERKVVRAKMKIS